MQIFCAFAMCGGIAFETITSWIKSFQQRSGGQEGVLGEGLIGGTLILFFLVVSLCVVIICFVTMVVILQSAYRSLKAFFGLDRKPVKSD